jgi:hypothetical protein
VLAATVVASNYLPHLRVLERSLHRWHPEARLVAVVVDGGTADALDHIELLTPADIGVDAAELHRRALLYDTQGVVSSLRWWLLSHLLDEAPVLLLDADMLVLARLDDLWELAAGAGVLLSPHALTPLPGRPGHWPEEELLRSGTFSGGFVGVGPAAGPFLDWMIERTARDCVRAPERGLLYGQTWLDLVPALFGHRILRDPGVNTQVHVLVGRDLAGDPPRLGETPVRLFHFAGFDPARPDRLCARHYAGAELEPLPGLERLCREYAEALADAGWPPPGNAPWATLADGTPVDDVMRAVFRTALLEGEQPPDPFEAGDPESFAAWLRAPAPGEVVSRYLLELHRLRPDLRAAFPNVSVSDAGAYLRWAAGKASEPGQQDLPPRLSP